MPMMSPAGEDFGERVTAATGFSGTALCGPASDGVSKAPMARYESTYDVSLVARTSAVHAATSSERDTWAAQSARAFSTSAEGKPDGESRARSAGDGNARSV
eukprot:Amastigsp_a342105_12.p3 type:complete len:102 gc:universal Amastigsp_a342105_12:377-682(+)